MQDTVGIVLAAGKGTRMGAERPKVLFELAGQPLVAHPLHALRDAGLRLAVVVVGHRGLEVRDDLTRRDFRPLRLAFAEQAEPRGTGHALLQALPALADDCRRVVVLSGDVPLLRAETVGRLIRVAVGTDGGCALATFRPPDPGGYGRILRDPAGRVLGIREERDASPEQRRIGECNAGSYCFEVSLLRRELPRLSTNNAQNEMYLTDLIAVCARTGRVETVEIDPEQAEGVNTPEQLLRLERVVAAAPASVPGGDGG